MVHNLDSRMLLLQPDGEPLAQPMYAAHVEVLQAGRRAHQPLYPLLEEVNIFQS